MSHSDSAFFKTFGVVIGALVLFTVFCIVLYLLSMLHSFSWAP